MSDIEYLIGLKDGNQRIINKFYEKFEKDFKKAVKSKFHILDDDLVAEVYQDSIVRLWENVKKGKLDVDSLSTSLAGYLYGIGINVMLETLRKAKEVSLDSLPEIQNICAKDDTLALQIAWVQEVEEPIRAYEKVHTKEEREREWFRLVDLYIESHKGKASVKSDADYEWERSYEEFEKRERESVLRDVVKGMGKPCTPLLVEFYWYGLSWEKIALKLGYSNADSAKTQKNKCMSKLKAIYK